LKAALEDRPPFSLPGGLAARRIGKKVVKGRGRWAERPLWIALCEEDMQAYLTTAFGWPQAPWCGWIARRRRPLWSEQWEAERVHVWIAGGAFPWPLRAAQAAALLRGHWGIQKGVFDVRDVTMTEDRLHGRKIGAALSSLRNVALTLLRGWIPAAYLPEARRKVAALPDDGLPLLPAPLKKPYPWEGAWLRGLP